MVNVDYICCESFPRIVKDAIRFSNKKDLKEGDVEFYYGSNDNIFWEILGEIFNKELTTEQNRKLFLKNCHIGMADIVKTCRRIKDGSSDSQLCDIECNMIIKDILEKNPKITKLVYTSEFVKRLINNSIATSGYHEEIDSKDRHWKVKIGNKKYEVFILYSPSANAQRSGITKEKIIKQYKKVLRAFKIPCQSHLVT